MRTRVCVAATIACVALSSAVSVASIQQNDVVIGISSNTPGESMRLIRSSVEMPQEWPSQPAYIQSIEFDNFGGELHSSSGVLFGVDYGAGDGKIYQCATDGSDVVTLLADSSGTLGGTALSAPSSYTGISVSPDNTKVAVCATDLQQIVIYDYNAGATPASGTGATLTNPRETAISPVPITTRTQGTCWLDNNTVLVYNTFGELITIDATTLAGTTVLTGLAPGASSSGVTDVEYNPDISPYVYCMAGWFSGSTTNKLFVVDPATWTLVPNAAGATATDYSVKDANFEGGMDTTREIAFDTEGSLYVVTYAANVMKIANASVESGGQMINIADNNSTQWWRDGGVFGIYTGIDIALGAGAGPFCGDPGYEPPTGDLNGDCYVEWADFGIFADNWQTCTDPAPPCNYVAP